MKAVTRFTVAAAAAGVLAAAGTAAPALASAPRHAVFVQTDNLKGNQIVTYTRSSEGTLTQAGVFPTGGLGGQLEGSAVDHTASQGALAYDSQSGLLYAVNAGSNTVSVFGVFGEKLALHQVISSGGTFPVSIAVHDGLVYVLNALEGGSVQGFTVSEGHLTPIAGSNRPLGLEPNATPQFTHSPGQVVFSPSGSQLIVTTKANGNDVDVFTVEAGGLLSGSPVVNPLPGTVPFAITFDRQGHLILSESAGALADFQLNASGTIQQLDVVPSEQIATCWVVGARGHFYTSNPGSASLSSFKESFGGQVLTLLGDTTTNGGTVDATVTPDERFLYVQTGAEGIVDEFSIGAQGALSAVGSVTVPGAIGGEGIVAG
ncbi:MAG TPA: beta-propeller fold lactonase family protein [Solirubrobacteraceae bacterium]|nr:beta-propeller fold lactonase family protein [Solirubrobacteraceae bacterium]